MTLVRHLTIDLLSDTSFSSGRGAAGDVDVDIELEMECLPRVGGKTLHGLLLGTWLQMSHAFPDLEVAATRVFGTPANFGPSALLRVGDGQMTRGDREWISWALTREERSIPPEEIRDSLTVVRTQTSEDAQTGAAKETTLRRCRAAKRGLRLGAPLAWAMVPADSDLRCLALAVLGTRHVGLGRRRGRGVVRMTLDGDMNLTRGLAGIGAMA